MSRPELSKEERELCEQAQSLTTAPLTAVGLAKQWAAAVATLEKIAAAEGKSSDFVEQHPVQTVFYTRAQDLMGRQGRRFAIPYQANLEIVEMLGRVPTAKTPEPLADPLASIVRDAFLKAHMTVAEETKSQSVEVKVIPELEPIEIAEKLGYTKGS